jgi:hypothetical protein
MITIGELKEYLGKLPEEFDSYEMVNGVVSPLIDGEYYVRIDHPVVQLQIDQESKELLILHQSEEEIDKITAEIDGDTEEG